MDSLDQIQKIDRSQNIDGWNVQLYFFSRNPRVLLAVALAFIAIGVGLAWAFQKPHVEDPTDDFKAETLREELDREHPDMDKVVAWLPKAAGGWREDAPVDVWITNSHLSDTEKLVANAYWNSLHFDYGFEPNADLLYYAHYVSPLRHANELIGDHYARSNDLTKAAAYFRREAKFPDASTAREKLIEIVMEQQDHKGLRELGNDPLYASNFKPENRLYFAAEERRWGDLIAPLKELQAQLLDRMPMILASIAGFVWFVIALQAVQPPGVFSFRSFSPVLAVVAGMASTFVTLIASVWAEEVLGIREGKGLVENFIFFMGSVGPREELIKLAFFLPFVPILLIRKSRLEMLMIAGCVGLGFAVWENLLYFKALGAAVAFPRFLTANFFHLALTALNGLALCDLLRNPVKGFLPFLGTLLITIAAHGGYDFLASVAEAPVFGIGAMVIYMLISLWFFRKLRDLRDGSTDQLSIAGTFVVGISVLAAAIIVMTAREIGFEDTLKIFIIIGLQMIMIGYMFFWQLGEGMSAVEEPSSTPYFR